MRPAFWASAVACWNIFYKNRGLSWLVAGKIWEYHLQPGDFPLPRLITQGYPYWHLCNSTWDFKTTKCTVTVRSLHGEIQVKLHKNANIMWKTQHECSFFPHETMDVPHLVDLFYRFTPGTSGKHWPTASYISGNISTSTSNKAPTHNSVLCSSLQ